MKISKYFAAVLAAVTMHVSMAAAAISTSTVSLPAATQVGQCTWTLIGAGPIQILTPQNGGSQIYAVSDTTPTGTAGYPLKQTDLTPVLASSNVYGCNFGSVAVGLIVTPFLSVTGYNFGPLSVTPTVQNAAYASGNAIGGLQTISVFRTTANPHAVLDYIQIASKGGSTTAITVYLFTKSPTSTCTDKTAFSFAAADTQYLVPGFPIVITPAVIGVGATASFAQKNGPWSANNQDTTASLNLYECLVVGGAVTPASVSDLVLSLAGIND